jgi:hypothetical protein
MPDKIENQESKSSSLVSVLGQLARQLRSQPLVFSLAILILLVIAGSLGAESLAALRVPALVIFGVGLLVWLVVELPKAKSRSIRTQKGISVRASNVGKSGKVSAIEGLPASKSAPSDVKMDVEDIDGNVAGVRYAQQEEKAKEKAKND